MHADMRRYPPAGWWTSRWKWTRQGQIHYTVKAEADSRRWLRWSDCAGKTYDTYTIDPTSGKGTNSANEAVDLPQTGNNSMKNLFVVFISVMLSGLGLAAMKFSGVIRRRKCE